MNYGVIRLCNPRNVIVGGSSSLGSCPMGSSYPDGCPSSPTGTPQYPHMLDVSSPGTQDYGLTLLARPPWNVPGVDYYVGIDRAAYPTDAALKDPWPGYPTASYTALATELQAWCHTFDGVTITLDQGGTTVVLDGYDFSLHGGLRLETNQGGGAYPSSVTLTNNKFVVGSNNANQETLFSAGQNPITVVIEKNFFDGIGNTSGSTGGIFDLGNFGTSTIRYNVIQNAWAECLRIDSNTTGGFSTTIQFNVVRNCGRGEGPTGVTVHGDLVQFGCGGSGNVFNNVYCNYNLWLQDLDSQNPSTKAAGQGITWAPEGENDYQEYKNNTLLVRPIAAIADYFMGYDLSWQKQTVISTNYITKNTGYNSNNTPSAAPGLSAAWAGGGSFSGTLTQSGNIDMMTGGATP